MRRQIVSGNIIGMKRTSGRDIKNIYSKYLLDLVCYRQIDTVVIPHIRIILETIVRIDTRKNVSTLNNICVLPESVYVLRIKIFENKRINIRIDIFQIDLTVCFRLIIIKERDKIITPLDRSIIPIEKADDLDFLIKFIEKILRNTAYRIGFDRGRIKCQFFIQRHIDDQIRDDTYRNHQNDGNDRNRL